MNNNSNQANLGTPSTFTKNQPDQQHDQPHQLRLCPIMSERTSTQILEEIYKIINNQKYRKQSSNQKNTSPSENVPPQLVNEKSQGSQNTMKCKCKKTKCLKLYCQCFALGQYCKDCNCLDCKNVQAFDQVRAIAIDEALNRDPSSFHSKIKQLKGGCICKKTGCLMKYCQCYNSGKKCTNQCKCVNCGNKSCQSQGPSQHNLKKPLTLNKGNLFKIDS